jgi:hypothetical protein
MAILASDNFNRADEDPLSGGGNWSVANSELKFKLISNAVVPAGPASDSGEYYSGVAWPNDQYSKAKLSCVGSGGGGAGVGLKVRQASGANTQYRVVVDHAAANNVDLQKVVAGSYSSVAGYPRTQAWADGDTWELRAQGTTLSVWLNGVQVGADATDNGIASGSAGIAFSSTETSASIEDWEGGDFSGATLTPQTGCFTMIADRMAKAIMIASAVHTVVGRHELRGAAKRTKVALPVVVDVKITPPKITTELLPYPRKGASIKRPRPFPEVLLTRKPLPITKSIALPHMLKGAPARKPRILPDVFPARVPAPVARAVVGKHTFTLAAPAPRIIADPTITAVRTPPPIARTSVGRATIQHPVTGSGAPITSMIEMDTPVARNFVGRRTRVAPAAPAASRPRPVTTLVWTPRPITDSTVGSPLPRIPIAARSLARPILALADTLRPLTKSSVGTPLPRAPIAARSLARPVLALADSLRPITETFIAAARRVVKPVVSRARPYIGRFRTPFPRTDGYAGSGIERGAAASLTLAIEVSRGTISLSGPGESIALSPENYGSISLNT